MNRREYNEFINSNYDKSEVLVIVAGICIVIFEVIFGVLNIVKTNRTLSDNLYLIAYATLLISTILVIGFCVFLKKIKYYKDILPWVLHIYDALIALWAVSVSFLDLAKNADKFIAYPIVFITVMFALPFFLRIHYSLNTVISVGGFIGYILYSYFRSGKFYVSYFSNLFVALVMIILVSILGYQFTLRNHKLELTLKESSIKDGLTKLFNRSALDDKLEEVSVGRDLFNVVMLDCDNFKSINDNYGHRVGDEALVKIAELIQREFGKDCFRYGGDEFIVITTFTANTVINTLEQINAELKEHFGEIHVSVTAGIYQIEKGSTVGHIVKCADEALYNAKNTKKGTVSVYKS